MWPGLPGLADPLAGAALIQFAIALEVSAVVTLHESVPELLLIARVCGGGTRPIGAEKLKEIGETPSGFAVTTFSVTAIPTRRQRPAFIHA